jgi:hypothetical protein
LLYSCLWSQQFHQKWWTKQKYWCTRWKIDIIQTGKLLCHKYAVYLIKYKVNAHKQCYILNTDWLCQQKVNMKLNRKTKSSTPYIVISISLHVITSSQQTYLNLKPLFVRVFPNWYIFPVSQTSPTSHTWREKICALIAI